MTSPEADAPVREGDVIASKYRVDRVLGAGGMGVVVAATHLDLEQRVAIKFLLPEAAKDTELVERFMREGRASVRLRGAHVVKTIDVGRLEGGAPFLVMEFLEGQTLRDYLQPFPNGMPLETMCSFLLQACEGVAEAHALGIVHRDLKPENLFITHGVDGWPMLKVLDFGISKIADENFAGSLTRTNTLFGSPLYMSPEQMRSAKHVDPRADVWSLGVIGYEMACGHPPFESDTMYDLCLKVAQDTPEPLATLRPELPPAVIDGLMACLDKSIGGRLQNVAELARALEPHAGARARGTAERLHDVLRASGAAFVSLAAAERTSASQVQSAWGATERSVASPRRRWLPLAAGGLAVAGVALVVSMRAAPKPPPAVEPAASLPSAAASGWSPAEPAPSASASSAPPPLAASAEPAIESPVAEPAAGAPRGKRPGGRSAPDAPPEAPPAAPSAANPASPPASATPPKPTRQDEFVDER